MQFGSIPTAEAVGCILAHGVRYGDGSFKKGRLLSAADVNALQVAGVVSIIAARLTEKDVPEDEAARKLALVLSGAGISAQQAFTGRANLHSTGQGLLLVDVARTNAINALHESLTIATLPAFTSVLPRQMLATVKIIPFATPRWVLEQALAIVGDQPLLELQRFNSKHIGLIVTRLPQTKASIVAKSEAAIRDRLARFGLSLAPVLQVDHIETDVSAGIAALKQRGADCILIFGASAIVDRGDVIPAALVAAGGAVVHLGMPVDPGNLLMLGKLGNTPVIGIPSCARSLKRNGFDWVLERVLAGVEISPTDIMQMGVGGLLAEISSRPSPREAAALVPLAPRIVAVLLAAGSSRRMGSNKLLADFEGNAMVRVVAQNLLASSADEVVVITGYEQQRVVEALAGLPLRFVHNPDHATGMASSLRVGAIAAECAEALVVVLADMPRVKPVVIDRLIAAFNPTEHRSIVVPTWNGVFGNPVLWGSEHFERLKTMTGDKGARALIDDLKSEATEIEIGDDGVLLDADTPEALAQIKSIASS